MTVARVLLALLFCGSVSGCVQGSFGRFMDNPITSWLPVDEYLGGNNANLKAPPMRRGQDKNCYDTAKERTEFSGVQRDMTVSEFQNLFRLEYATCLKSR